MPIVGSITILKQTVELHANSDGWWSARLPVIEGEAVGTYLAAGRDLARVKRDARRKLRDLRIPTTVPFLTYAPATGDVWHAIGRGIHMRTGEVLAWVDDPNGGANTTYSRWNTRVLSPATSHTAIKLYYEKQRKLQDAQRKLKEWWDANTFDLRQAVEDAVKAHTDTLDPTEIDEVDTEEEQ